MYNKNGTIKKYKVIKNIMEEFYKIRLAMYQKRKDYILDKLKNELDIISYKVKFILAVIAKEIKINNKTKDFIEGKLEENEYPKLSRNNSDEKNYNYLLGMNLWSLTYEKVEELKKQKDDKEAEYNLLKDKSIKDIWKEELNELLDSYNKWYQEKKDETEDVKVKTKNKIKKIKKKSDPKSLVV